jgi:hypothetical protein
MTTPSPRFAALRWSTGATGVLTASPSAAIVRTTLADLRLA